MSRSTVGALMMAGVLALAGCGGTDRIAEEAVEDATNGDVKIDKNGDEFEVEVQGQKVKSKQGDLVDGFPSDIPMPSEYDVVSSSTAQGKFQAFGRIPSAEKAFAFYKAELPKKGWNVTVASAAEGTFQVVADKGGRALVVGSAPSNEGANLTVVLE